MDVSHEKVSRRSFFATLGAMAIAPHIPADTPMRDFGVPENALPEELDRINRIVGSLMGFEAPTGPALLWAEIDPDGKEKPGFMLWTPETEEEHAAAERFRNAVAWKPWMDMRDLRYRLSDGGSWLVRIRNPGQLFVFVAPAGVDGGGVVGSDTSHLGMSGDPKDALVVCSTRAVEIIRDLVAEGYGDNGLQCIEPVRPSQPWRDGRYQCLARPKS